MVVFLSGESLAANSSSAMAAAPLPVLLLLLAAAASGYPRDGDKAFPGSVAGSGVGSFPGSGAGAFSGASSFSSSSGTRVSPGPGGYGNFNAFAGNFGPPGFVGGGFAAPPLYRGPEDMGQLSQPQFGFPGFNPFVPQYGQQYPYVAFPPFPAPFDFTAFLNQYFQALQSFQAQAAAQGQQAAGSGGLGSSLDSNEVGGVGGLATATYSPQGGYGSANVFPAPAGGLETRFGAEDGGPNSVMGAGVRPVSSVSGSFKPPGGTSFGVFTSSSSGSSDINGKKTSFKQSTIGVNDNGKVTTYTAHDP